MQNMDKSWMLYDRCHHLYIQGIFDFLRFVDYHAAPGTEWHKCPCRKCMCNDWQTRSGIEQHLSHFGMWNNYTIWMEHGEVEENNHTLAEFRASYIHEVGSSNGTADPSIYPVMNMLHDVFPYASRYEEEAVDDDAPNVNEAVDMSEYERYNRLLEQAQTPVYDDCPVSVLSAIMSQMHLKVKYRTSNEHYGDYPKFIKTLLPPVNRLPESHYKTKKILGDLGLDYVKIHACKNNYVVFLRRLQACYLLSHLQWAEV
uniref:uncharacterized protein LOC105350424 n=1 Tax=Fragaria vesca subsp. vesca TaxID=101020 RepID=UPI0005C95E52|nr:PREDICTED: uncharacterized protein LOC105350424 [Fragaria vesca subsp. vesca]